MEYTYIKYHIVIFVTKELCRKKIKKKNYARSVKWCERWETYLAYRQQEEERITQSSYRAVGNY